MKTPTAAAAFFTERLREVEIRIDDAHQRILRAVEQAVGNEKLRLNHLALRIPSLFAIVKTRQNAKIDTLFMRAVNACNRTATNKRHRIEQLAQTIPPAVLRKVSQEKHRLEMLASKVSNLDPQLLLDRGYSITTFEGKAVKDPTLLPVDAIIETRLKSGRLTSRVINVDNQS